MREEIRRVMRFSGPRMLFYHPVQAIWHGERKNLVELDLNVTYTKDYKAERYEKNLIGRNNLWDRSNLQKNNTKRVE